MNRFHSSFFDYFRSSDKVAMHVLSKKSSGSFFGFPRYQTRSNPVLCFSRKFCGPFKFQALKNLSSWEEGALYRRATTAGSESHGKGQKTVLSKSRLYQNEYDFIHLCSGNYNNYKKEFVLNAWKCFINKYWSSGDDYLCLRCPQCQ